MVGLWSVDHRATSAASMAEEFAGKQFSSSACPARLRPFLLHVKQPCVFTFFFLSKD
jgi:hypothetical protein